MALDEQSRRRLEELGRRLPQPLPKPEPTPQAASAKRHRIETETDPATLFQELMQASPDGTVPPHLLDRLRQLEQRPAPQPLERQSVGEQPRPEGQRRQGSQRLKRQRNSREEPDPLYVTFEQMLLENDEP